MSTWDSSKNDCLDCHSSTQDLAFISSSSCLARACAQASLRPWYWGVHGEQSLALDHEWGRLLCKVNCLGLDLHNVTPSLMDWPKCHPIIKTFTLLNLKLFCWCSCTSNLRVGLDFLGLRNCDARFVMKHSPIQGTQKSLSRSQRPRPISWSGH